MLMYVQRNDNAEIIAVSKEATFAAQEPISTDDPELQAFFEHRQQAEPEQAKAKLKDSDLALIRVLEDLIDILIAKNIITFTDFPEASQSKILARQKIRDMLREVL